MGDSRRRIVIAALLLQHPPNLLCARLQVAGGLRETQPCGLNQTHDQATEGAFRRVRADSRQARCLRRRARRARSEPAGPPHEERPHQQDVAPAPQDLGAAQPSQPPEARGDGQGTQRGVGLGHHPAAGAGEVAVLLPANASIISSRTTTTLRGSRLCSVCSAVPVVVISFPSCFSVLRYAPAACSPNESVHRPSIVTRQTANWISAFGSSRCSSSSPSPTKASKSPGNCALTATVPDCRSMTSSLDS